MISADRDRNEEVLHEAMRRKILYVQYKEGRLMELVAS